MPSGGLCFSHTYSKWNMSIRTIYHRINVLCSFIVDNDWFMGSIVAQPLTGNCVDVCGSIFTVL